MQIAIGLTHLSDPYFNALDSIIAGFAVSISRPPWTVKAQREFETQYDSTGAGVDGEYT